MEGNTELRSTPHKYNQQINKCAKLIQLREDNISNKQCWCNWVLYRHKRGEESDLNTKPDLKKYNPNSSGLNTWSKNIKVAGYSGTHF